MIRKLKGAALVAALVGGLWLANQLGTSDLDSARYIEQQLTHLQTRN